MAISEDGALMRWFKHITNARNDPFVRELMYEFGSDGYAAWFGTIEIIAEDLEASDIRECGRIVKTLVKESPRFFSEQLIIPVEKLKKVYLHIKKRKKGRFVESDGKWTIDIPKVLEFMDEWTERVLSEMSRNPRESLPSDSGKKRAEEKRREEIADLRKGKGGPGAGGLAFLAEEFVKLTGNSGFTKIRNVQHVIDTLGPLVEKRGLDPCVALMKKRVEDAKRAGTKVPSNLSYFIPVFKDDSAFPNGNGHAEKVKRAGGPASVGDIVKGIVKDGEEDA